MKRIVLLMALWVTGMVMMTLSVAQGEGSDRRPVGTESPSPLSVRVHEDHPQGESEQEPVKEPEKDGPRRHDHSGMSKDPSRPASPHDHSAISSNGGGVVWGAMDTRNASGTSWQPAGTSEPMIHRMADGWMLMLHGNAFGTFNHQGGPRGAGKLESFNWGMLMAEHDLGPRKFTARAMLSLEPLTIPHGGSPELFQTGETYRNRPLIDHQHPHNFFMELAALYTLPLAERTAVQIYGGPVGEPALGPTAFMHRLSATELSAAPLNHHLTDSTHISEGVITLGLIHGPLKVEASAFNGHEPGEERWGIHTSGLNSYSFRATVNPTDRWSGQVSMGHLRKPEALEPGNLVRSTASITYYRPLASGHWATTALWGRNREEHAHLNGYLLESTLNFQRSNYVFTRLELLDKVGLLGEPETGRETGAGPSFRVGAYTLGFVRDLPIIPGLTTGLGGDVAFYSKPAALDPIYGKSPVSFRVFLRLRPPHARQ